MIITLIICALNIALITGYAIVKGHALKKRCIALADKNAEHPDETLAWELKEYYHNLCELGLRSVAICICAIVAALL